MRAGLMADQSAACSVAQRAECSAVQKAAP